MRFDDVGLWWQDFPQEKTGNKLASRSHAPVPTSTWRPRALPNLAAAKVISIDTETKDTELLTKGPGGVTGRAHVVGLSVAVDEDAWYFPMRHEYEGQRSMNMDPAHVFAWLTDLFSRKVPVVGANLLYDLEMLRNEGVRMPAGALHDVQYAEPLLDEEMRSYSLESLAQKHLGQGKTTSALYQWCADSFGGKAGREQAANIWRSPPTIAGPYAEQDAILPLKLLRVQQPLLKAEGLWELYRMECRLIPLLLDMRFRGVRVDVDAAERVLKHLNARAKEAQVALGSVDVWSGDSIARAFDRAGIEYPRTEAGNPSFTKEFLAGTHHDLAQRILLVRQYEKAANPFVESYILGNAHKGRVHCQFHPLRSDSFGTVSGRFSSSNPNLQNIPSRDEVIGPMLRGLFIPEEGCSWRRSDYSQIEYRMLAHFATGDGADTIRQRYRDDPRTDFHALTIDMVREVTGIELGRKAAKNLNFGLVYGMGKDKTVRSLGVDEATGARLYDAYFTAFPSVRATNKAAQRLAQRRGYVKTILGRRRRFNRMEKDPGHGGESRTGVHAALNASLQGSSADIIKRAMVQCYEGGVFADTGIPHLTIHDELDWSNDRSERAQVAFMEAKRVMQECVPCNVPILTEEAEGANWGECK